LIAGESRLFPMEVLREDLRHFYIFVLLKGSRATTAATRAA